MKLKEQKIINKESNDKQNAPSSSLKSHKKNQYKYIVWKSLSALETFPNN